jgi:two-component system, OmpR family, phosphate regulon sensor histidine kinase PhoR
MKRKSILRGLFSYYLLIMLVSLVALGWYASYSIKQFYLDQTVADLEIRGGLAREALSSHLNPFDSAAVARTVAESSRNLAIRISIFHPDGQLWYDSELDSSKTPAAGPGPLPELAAAKLGKTGVDHRFSRSINQDILYVALPLQSSSGMSGVVRVALPLGFIDAPLRQVRWRIGIAGLIVLLMALAASVSIGRRIGGPIQELRASAERFARGDLSGRLALPDSEEFAALGEAMNEMAHQLDDRIKTITRQRNEQEAILTSMFEGVLAVDIDERVMNLNRTASRLFDITPADAKGRTIQEVIRNTNLQQLIKQTLESRRPVQGDVTLTENGELHLQAHGTVLRDSEGKSLGALLVLHDITQLKKLESVRRDFVANVSHELKTPITSIKGFVETLQDGAVRNPDDAERFLGIIAKHVDRLNAIIEDLLALSRIEQEAERAEIPLEVGPLQDVVKAAVQACASKAKEKSVAIEIHGESSIQIRRNSILLEQAVINLLDNAIKYSDSGMQIEVAAEELSDEVIIAVTDHGCGIGKEHLPRLWERFYRVDKARSRTLGGTGLGLAIVKHIVLAHGGRVSVESVIGHGSTFRIHLPSVRDAA